MTEAAAPSKRFLARGALLRRAEEMTPDRYRDGVAFTVEDNLIFPPPLEFEPLYRGGSANGWAWQLKLAHSSAALCANTFLPFMKAPGWLELAGCSGFRDLRFHQALATGLGGRPPHLDLMAEGAIPVAVESVCTEYFEAKPPDFPPVYDRVWDLRRDSPWFAQIERLRLRPNTYRHLDVERLMKMYLALARVHPRTEVVILYLFWEPLNAAELPECQAHRAELKEFRERVLGSNVRLEYQAYADVWAQWAESRTLRGHVARLRERYGVAVG